MSLMNISGLFTSRASGHWGSAAPASQPVKGLSSLAQAVENADKKIESEVITNTAQLSSFGQLKSSVSQTQLAAQAMSQLPLDSSVEDIHKAAAAFVKAFNAAIDTAKSTAALPGNAQAAQSAGRVSTELQRAFMGNPSISDELAKMGVTLQDGLVQVDAKRFSSAMVADPYRVQDALAMAADMVGQTAEVELSSQGNVSSPMNTLYQRARMLEANQSALQAAAQATSSPLGNVNAGILKAYQANA